MQLTITLSHKLEDHDSPTPSSMASISRYAPVSIAACCSRVEFAVARCACNGIESDHVGYVTKNSYSILGSVAGYNYK